MKPRILNGTPTKYLSIPGNFGVVDLNCSKDFKGATETIKVCRRGKSLET